MEITGFDSKYHSNNIKENQETINNLFEKRRLDSNQSFTTNIIPPSSWRYSGENGMGTDNIKNNDNLEDQFKLQVIKKNGLVSFNETNSNFTSFDNTVENNIKECFSMNTKKRDFEQFNDYNEQKTPLKLDIFSGSSRNYFSKTEIEPFFQPVKDMSFVNGMGVITDKFEDRYNDAIRLEKRNERPFEPEKVGPHPKGKYTGFHDTTRVLPKLTDELRRSDQPKLSYSTDPIKGKTINKRSIITPIVKRLPDKFKELEQKDLIPKSQVSSAAIRDNYNLILSNRAILSKEVFGAPKDQINKKFDIQSSGIAQESTRNKYSEPENKNISGLVQIYNNNKNSVNLPQLERNEYQINYSNVNNQNKVQSVNPNNTTKPTIRQTLNNLEYNNINTKINKVQSYNPDNCSKPTIRQTLNNIDYNNINTGVNKTQYFDPNDTTKPTIRQDLNNIDYSNIITGANKTQSFDPNNITKTTTRQTLSNIEYLNLINNTNKTQTMLSDKPKMTIKETLPILEHNNIKANKNIITQLSDKAKTTNKENINIDTLKKYNNLSLNKKNIANLSDEARQTLKELLDNINYTNIQINNNKSMSGFQDVAKNTQQLPHFNNENLSTFKNIKITDIEKLRHTIRELTNSEIITAPCASDKAITSYLNDIAKITNKETTLYENNGNLQTIDGSFVNTYETPEITLKQLLDYNDYLSIIHNNNGSYAYDPNDIAKTTNKQDTISYNYDNHAHYPMYGGYQSETHEIQNTLKDITKVVNYLNNPNASTTGNVLKDNYLNSKLNRVKEEIMKNRDPTPVGSFQAPDTTNINLLLKDKPNINYTPPPHINNINIDDRVNMILTSLKNNPYYNDRIDISLQDSLKTNQIINNMVHKSY